MDLSRKWLTEFVDVPVSAVNDRDFSEAMTLSGSKVETYEDHGAQFKNVVVGRILAMERHPDSALWEICGGDLSRVEGRTPFQGARQGDPAAAP